MTREPIGPNDAMDRLLERRLRRLPVPVESGSLCADPATLASFVDGDLEDDERTRWEAHFASCAACRQTLRVLAASAPADAVAAGPVGIVRTPDVAASARPAAGEPAEADSAPASEMMPHAASIAGALAGAQGAQGPRSAQGPRAAQGPQGAEGTPSSASARTTAADDARPSSIWGARTWIALAASLVAAAGLWLTVRSTPSFSQPETMQVATGAQSPASDVPPEGRAHGTGAFSAVPSRRAPSQVAPSDATPSQVAPSQVAPSQVTPARGAPAEGAPSKAASSPAAPAASAAADRFARAEPVERDEQRAPAAARTPKPVAGAAGAGAASGGRREEPIAERANALASKAKPSSSSPELAERAAPPAPAAVPAPSVARSAESRKAEAEAESLALSAQAAAPATTRDTAVNQRAAAPAAPPPATAEAARVAKSQPGASASASAPAAAQSGGASSATGAARQAGEREPATAAAASADLDASRAAKVGMLARARGDTANSATSPAAARTFASPDGARAWRFAGPGVIVTSTDGERSWQTEFSDPAVRLNAGRAVSSIVCWVVGADGLVLRRDETGRWNRLAALPIAADLRVVLAASETSATVVAVDGTSYRTQDRGRTWQALPAVVPPAAARPRPE